MKNNKVNVGKLNLNKMTISSLQSVNGGKMAIDASGDGCDSKDGYCNSQATNFTNYKECCTTVV
ncbi:hypothetical protein ACWGOQ_0018270 [Aquimarina sp. M1]